MALTHTHKSLVVCVYIWEENEEALFFLGAFIVSPKKLVSPFTLSCRDVKMCKMGYNTGL
jgi:hypothetical protein